MKDSTAVHEGFRIGLITPVIAFVADRNRQCGRHVDEDVPPIIGTTGFEYQHLVAGVFAEPVGQNATRGTAADNNEVVLHSQVSGFHVYRLQLRVVLDRPLGILAPDARHFVAAKWNLDRRDVVCVDPAGTGLELPDYAMSSVQIVGKDACGQSVVRVVGPLDDFLFL